MTVVAEIIQRLLDIEPPVFSIVESAAEFAALDGAVPNAVPAAYVMTLREATAENERMTGPVMQRCEADIGVVLVTSNLSDHRGGAAAGDIEALKIATRHALLGFEPASAEPLEHVSGELIKAKGGTVWHEEVYSTATYLREQT